MAYGITLSYREVNLLVQFFQLLLQLVHHVAVRIACRTTIFARLFLLAFRQPVFLVQAREQVINGDRLRLEGLAAACTGAARSAARFPYRCRQRLAVQQLSTFRARLPVILD